YAPSGNLSQPWQIVPLGSPLQQEYFSQGGLQRKWYIVGEEPGQVILELKLRKSTPYYAHPIIVTDTVKLTVLKIEEVKWVGSSISPLDENPNAGGGLRIFPDKNTPNDQPKGLVKRTVGVLVTINPPLPNIMVYLQYFDIDDPNESRIPVDDESKSHDNRQKQEVGFFTYTIRPPQSSITHDTDSSLHQIGGMPAEYRFFNTDSKPTNNFGKVYVSFMVSMQPGDNYRVVADLAEYEWINTLCVPQRTRYGEVHTRFGNNVSENQITDLLTVWRRLWIERDIMSSWQSLDEVSLRGKVVFNNPNFPVNGYTFVVIDLHNPDPNSCSWASQPNCLEGGYIKISTPDEARYPIVTSRMTRTKEGVNRLLLVVRGVPPDNNVLLNKNVIVFDDDNLNILPQTPDGGSTLINAFKKAYVLPIYWDAWTDYLPFSMFVVNINLTFLNNSYASKSFQDIDCWTVYLISAWEGTINEDAEPDDIVDFSFFNSQSLKEFRPSYPEEYMYGCYVPRLTRIFIFYQVMYDFVSQHPSEIVTLSHLAEHVIAHEIGHYFSPDHEPLTIMSAGDPQLALTYDDFGPIFLDIIRSTRIP
ncbi:MAG: hypothetical protein QXX20_03015, partial [Candidatus Thermoplasmatota archaeon]